MGACRAARGAAATAGRRAALRGTGRSGDRGGRAASPGGRRSRSDGENAAAPARDRLLPAGPRRNCASAVRVAAPWQPGAAAPAGRPPSPPRGGGRCRGPEAAGRASRLRDQSAPAPRTPRSRVAGSGAAGKRAASGGSVPAQAPHRPGETRGSPAGLERGAAQAPGDSAAGRPGRDRRAAAPRRPSSRRMKAPDPLPRPL